MKTKKRVPSLAGAKTQGQNRILRSENKSNIATAIRLTQKVCSIFDKIVYSFKFIALLFSPQCTTFPYIL